jgi:E3 ubiquitin-protein ligase listerin
LLITLLADFPIAWDLETSFVSPKDEEAEEENSEGDNSENEDNKAAQLQDVSSMVQRKISLAYQDFLRFLELGCSGSPLQGYPTVVVILSTIPPPVRTICFTCVWVSFFGRFSHTR